MTFEYFILFYSQLRERQGIYEFISSSTK